MPPRSGSHREREARVEQRIPWDAQVVNAAPSSLLWRKGSSEITVKLPGLYRICVSVFTGLPVSLTVSLRVCVLLYTVGILFYVEWCIRQL